MLSFCFILFRIFQAAKQRKFEFEKKKENWSADAVFSFIGALGIILLRYTRFAPSSLLASPYLPVAWPCRRRWQTSFEVASAAYRRPVAPVSFA
jgi:hypothetical protein